jgi:RNA polymerase sigma-70 factor (ECF subfamily)
MALQLREAIATLPEKERVALHAFYLQQQDVEQARMVLGLSRSGFYRVLSVARERLRRVLSRSEFAQ